MGHLKSDQVNFSASFRSATQFLRKIEVAVNLSWLSPELAPHCSPSIDSERMIWTLVARNVFAIRSERLIFVNERYRAGDVSAVYSSGSFETSLRPVWLVARICS
jgi:hypothetical protein